MKIDPQLDLVLEREVDVPVARVWAAWTRAELLKQWFCPRPWSVPEAELDPRPGGIFRTVMQSPEGQLFPSEGCFLEVVPERKLVWTDALRAGFRPNEKPFMTGVLLLEPLGERRTRYVAMAIHNDAAARQQHDQMGFYEGWGAALDQLIELMREDG